MQKKKPQGKKALDPNKAAAFVAGADEPAKTSTKAIENEEPLPWDDPSVREDVTKVFNLRLPEPLFLKLKWLSENTPKTSMQKVCMDAVSKSVEEEVRKTLNNI